MNRAARADALIGALLALGDAALRASYVASVATAWPIAEVAAVLDTICERAQQADVASREALVAMVDALNADGMQGVARALREQAAQASLLALERLIRHAGQGRASSPPAAKGQAIPERVGRHPGQPRELTLGERKSLARRPDRETLLRLFADPHPDVIRRLLRNPRLTEDDVLRLAAKRPGRAEVLAEVARSIRWVHRPRIRMALVMNPATPGDIAARIAGLLLRTELAMVAGSPGVPAAVRAVCLEHLERRPPVAGAPREGVH